MSAKAAVVGEKNDQSFFCDAVGRVAVAIRIVESAENAPHRLVEPLDDRRIFRIVMPRINAGDFGIFLGEIRAGHDGTMHSLKRDVHVKRFVRVSLLADEVGRRVRHRIGEVFGRSNQARRIIPHSRGLQVLLNVLGGVRLRVTIKGR